MRAIANATCFLFLFCVLETLPAQKLQVYILAGQSNMQGHARISTFDYVGDDAATAPLLAEMRDAKGKPRIRDDVWIAYLTGGKKGDGEGHGKLTAGYGARKDPTRPGDKIGPELTFGITVGKATSGPVLIIKTAWGGKSLHTDFRPPSAGPYRFADGQLARWKSQGKDIGKMKAAKAEATGKYYRAMIAYVRRVLADIPRVCPAYDADEGYELGGFVWFQGWNDMVDSGTYPDRAKPGGYADYSECLGHFIRDVRKDLTAPRMPFVIGVMGVGGPIQAAGGKKDRKRSDVVQAGFRAAMAAPAARKEFVGNVVAVPTAPYWDLRLAAIADKLQKVKHMERTLRAGSPGSANEDGSMDREQQRAWLARYRRKLVSAEDEALFERGASNAGYHYLGSAKTMAQIGKAFADAILAMQGGRR